MLQEGDKCPCCIDGSMRYIVEDCSCHINPPCGACVDAPLQCKVCSYEEEICDDCGGSGEVYVLRNARGEVDFLTGKPTNETTRCDSCRGEGVR